MKTNDIKKGDRIRMRNGWEGTMADNQRGNIRVAEIEGHFTEIGSVYAHDIVAVRPVSQGDPGTAWVEVEHTDKQLKFKAQMTALRF